MTGAELKNRQRISRYGLVERQDPAASSDRLRTCLDDGADECESRRRDHHMNNLPGGRRHPDRSQRRRGHSFMKTVAPAPAARLASESPFRHSAPTSGFSDDERDAFDAALAGLTTLRFVDEPAGSAAAGPRLPALHADYVRFGPGSCERPRRGDEHDAGARPSAGPETSLRVRTSSGVPQKASLRGHFGHCGTGQERPTASERPRMSAQRQ